MKKGGAQQSASPGILGVLRFIRNTSGSGKEGETPRNGLLSYPAEWHSAAIAFAVGYAGTTDLAQVVMTYSLGRGGAKKQLGDDAHIRDLADEPAYALAALSVGKMLRTGQMAIPAIA